MMNARPNNEGAIADNDHMKTIILELIYIRLLIWYDELRYSVSG